MRQSERFVKTYGQYAPPGMEVVDLVFGSIVCASFGSTDSVSISDPYYLTDNE